MINFYNFKINKFYNFKIKKFYNFKITVLVRRITPPPPRTQIALPRLKKILLWAETKIRARTPSENVFLSSRGGG